MQKNNTFGEEHLNVIYQDKWLAVVYKPSGLLSVSYPGSREKTALDILSLMQTKQGRQRAAIVHRLDRDTSGLMMFALTGEAKELIMDGWRTIVTERKYIAVAESADKPLPDKGLIDAPLARNKNNNTFVPPSVGKKWGKTEEARTHFRILERGAYYDLVELELETGRKNQIRAHLSFLHHPIAGDAAYRARTDPFGRLALHARTLAFIHPYTKECLRFEINEPEGWKKTVINCSREYGETLIIKKQTEKAPYDGHRRKGTRPNRSV